jgi:hypothetical protein
MIDFCGLRLRSNPLFRLVPYDRLRGPHFEALRSLGEEPDFFGILIPPEGSVLPVKSVSRDAALLFLALREPDCLPHLLDSLFGAGVDDRARQLVLDGVFEIELSGNFVSGAAALRQLGWHGAVASGSRLARINADAIAYAAALEEVPAQDLAVRLYLYNTAPSTPALQRRFATDERLFGFLLEASEATRQRLTRWRSEPVGDSWISWSTAGSAWRPAYKLYVSPVQECLAQVFAHAVQAFAETKCAHFKLGRGAFGVLRPDKLVAYFRGLDELHHAAELLSGSIAGVAAQGVPFTAPIDEDGLLSWGMDPPRFRQVLAWQEHQSWRQWLTGRIAGYILAAKEAGGDVDAFVHTRVELDGVDPRTWSPDLAIWRGPAGSEQEAG